MLGWPWAKNGVGMVRFLFAVGLVWSCWMSPTAALGAELSTWLGATAGTSAWRGDGGGGVRVAAALRWRGWLGAELGVGESLARVDQRVNTAISLGLTAILPGNGVQPTLRALVVHQHEEGLVSVKALPWGTTAGIGPGIRHRAGVGLEIGGERRWLDTALGAARLRILAVTSYFPDATLGPAWYLGVAFDAGLAWQVVSR